MLSFDMFILDISTQKSLPSRCRNAGHYFNVKRTFLFSFFNRSSTYSFFIFEQRKLSSIHYIGITSHFLFQESVSRWYIIYIDSIDKTKNIFWSDTPVNKSGMKMERMLFENVKWGESYLFIWANRKWMEEPFFI